MAGAWPGPPASGAACNGGLPRRARLNRTLDSRTLHYGAPPRGEAWPACERLPGMGASKWRDSACCFAASRRLGEGARHPIRNHTRHPDMEGNRPETGPRHPAGCRRVRVKTIYGTHARARISGEWNQPAPSCTPCTTPQKVCRASVNTGGKFRTIMANDNHNC